MASSSRAFLLPNWAPECPKARGAVRPLSLEGVTIVQQLTKRVSAVPSFSVNTPRQFVKSGVIVVSRCGPVFHIVRQKARRSRSISILTNEPSWSRGGKGKVTEALGDTRRWRGPRGVSSGKPCPCRAPRPVSRASRVTRHVLGLIESLYLDPLYSSACPCHPSCNDNLRR